MPIPITPTTPPKNGPFGGQPWWVQAIAWLGIPGVLVLYLVYSGVENVPAIRRSAERNTDEILRNREMIQALTQQSQINTRILQRICANTGKTDDERQRCFD